MILQMLFYFIKNLNGFIRFLTTQIIYFIFFRNNSYKTRIRMSKQHYM